MSDVITTGREIEVSEPTGVVAKRRQISPRRLDRAARELNMLTVNARGLRNFSAVGRFLDQVGIVDYGNGRLVASAEALDGAIKHCAELVHKEGIDDETKTAFMELQLRFVRAMDSNIELMLELNGATKINGTPHALPSKPFLPGAQISPINIQINANAAEKKMEEPAC